MNYLGTSSFNTIAVGSDKVKAIYSSSGDFTYIDAARAGLLKSAANIMMTLNTASADVDTGQSRAAVNTGASSTIAFQGPSSYYGDFMPLQSVSDTATVTKIGVYNVSNNSITSSKWTSPAALRLAPWRIDDQGCFHCRQYNWSAINNPGNFYKIDPATFGKISNDVITSSISIASSSYRYGSCPLLLYKDGTMYSAPANHTHPYLLHYYPDQMSASYERIHLPSSGSYLNGNTVRGAFFSEDYSKLFWHANGNVIYVNMATFTASFVGNVGDTFNFIRGPDGNAIILGTAQGSSAVRVNITASLSNPTTTTLGSNPGQSNMGLIIGNDGRVYILPYWTSAKRLWYAYDPVYASGSANWKPPISGAYNGAGYRTAGAILHANGKIYTFSQYEKFVLTVQTTGSASTYGYAASQYSTSGMS